MNDCKLSPRGIAIRAVISALLISGLVALCCFGRELSMVWGFGIVLVGSILGTLIGELLMGKVVIWRKWF